MVINLTARRIDARGVWLLSWSSTLPADPPPTYWIYRDGTLVAVTTASTYLVSVAAGESPVFTIADDAATEAPRGYPSRLLLAWYGSADTRRYRVQELVGATWTTRRSIPENGRGYYQHRTGVLDDGVVHQWRIVAEGTNGNDAAPAAFSVLMVRVPDPPVASMTYNPLDGTVAIASAG